MKPEVVTEVITQLLHPRGIVPAPASLYCLLFIVVAKTLISSASVKGVGERKVTASLMVEVIGGEPVPSATRNCPASTSNRLSNLHFGSLRESPWEVAV